MWNTPYPYLFISSYLVTFFLKNQSLYDIYHYDIIKKTWSLLNLKNLFNTLNTMKNKLSLIPTALKN